ncbi:MAG: alginate lyase family protein [Candidatus Latescibacteria bacterium]|nr:alginate lyase family protein [Candidatus Latescibacterota bacterium]MBT5829122.1 alginate lyase family protein [Candidatus Latescibacterota bacterium]
MFISQNDIAAIRKHVQDGLEPWQSAYVKLMADAERALAQERVSVTRKGEERHDYWTDPPYRGWSKKDKSGPDARDGQINPESDRGDYMSAIALDNSVRHLGLAYAFTGDGLYAKKAVDLLQVWCVDEKTYMEPKLTNGQSPIELYITMPGMIYGGSLVLKSGVWDKGIRDKWLDWVRAFSNDVRATEHKNNFENWRLVFLATAGVVLEDQDLLDEVFEQWRSIIDWQMSPEGWMVHETGRTKSLDYSTYALNAMSLTAEIARQQGVDLYGYTLADGRGLKFTLDHHAPFIVNPRTWPHEQIAPYKGDNAAIFELAYARFEKPEYKAVIERWGRPMFEKRIAGPVTLTHGVAF